ncbi:hypothetical protein BO71DRAFT_396373 [Aspergillus ellipticus CBS 707.79]|uniref:Uncharacterized protein n=1 Tax=Aspergillus ellipticus CBS 707.79 TaxID=1448320 RepID=A0A319DK82_9EURO|nr:hypothetical protein BO71DRAFT_396373 [Aspergillus ellipticus CBS 707.79]
MTAQLTAPSKPGVWTPNPSCAPVRGPFTSADLGGGKNHRPPEDPSMAGGRHTHEPTDGRPNPQSWLSPPNPRRTSAGHPESFANRAGWAILPTLQPGC